MEEKKLYKVFVDYINTADSCDHSVIIVKASNKLTAEAFARGLYSASGMANYIGHVFACETTIHTAD